MEIKDLLVFISSLVSSLAWPAAIVILVFVFRAPMQKLLEGLTRLRYGDLEIDFGREVQSIKEQATKAGIEQAPKTTSEKTETRDSTQIIADAFKLAVEFPEPSVVLAWTAIEYELLQVGMRFDISSWHQGLPPPSKSINFLRKHGHLENETCEVLDRMRKLRNIAAHPVRDKVRVSSDEATEFVSLAEAVTDKLKKLKPGFNSENPIQ